jgi:hypothetical protein
LEGTNEDGAAPAGDPASAARGLAIVRPEEWGLLAILAGCAVLCVALGHGFSGSRVLVQYFSFFGNKVLLVFAATRLLFGLAVRWDPIRGSRAHRVKRFVFGEEASPGELLKTDLEVFRGLVALFVTLTVYTNVKLRIPLINAFVGDPSLQRIDDAIFGTQLWPWLERMTRETDWLRGFLENVYFHDYLYFVLLVTLLYLRHDRLALRWLFQGVVYLYILGVLTTLAYPTLGPCFVRLDDYQWIQESSGMLADTQRNLWRYFSYVVQAGRAGQEVTGQVFMGIAAFPSLHVGHMALLTFVAWRCYRVYAPVVAVMTVLTFVATMAFGWHYAVDAIGGVALAFAVSAALWRVLPRWHERAEAGG